MANPYTKFQVSILSRSGDISHTHTHTHTRLTAFCPGLPGWAGKGKGKGKRSIAVRKKPHRYGNSRAIWDHTVLPATRKVKPIWILLKQETVSGNKIRWAICKSAPCSRQITTPASHRSVFYRPDALPAAQPTASKH